MVAHERMLPGFRPKEARRRNRARIMFAVKIVHCWAGSLLLGRQFAVTSRLTTLFFTDVWYNFRRTDPHFVSRDPSLCMRPKIDG